MDVRKANAIYKSEKFHNWFDKTKEVILNKIHLMRDQKKNKRETKPLNTQKKNKWTLHFLCS